MPHQLTKESGLQADDSKLDYYINYHDETRTLTDVCFFSSYSFSGKVEDYVFFYLKAIKDAGFSIVFISTSQLKEACILELKKYAFLVIEKENKCPDFGAWKIGLSLLNWGKNLNSVLLTNDSVFGPFFDLSRITDLMNKRFDVWGMTDSYEIDYHLQSYYLQFNKKAIQSANWTSFWKGVDMLLPYKEIISRYEVGLSQSFLKEKFRIGAYAGIDVVKRSAGQQHKHINAALAYWKLLIGQYEFPFLKRKIIISWREVNEDNWNKGLYINLGTWRRFIAENTNYPVMNIDNFLNRHYQHKKDQNKNVALRKRKILFLSHNADIGGAQRVLLNFLSWFKQHTDIPFETIICSDSKNRLLSEFSVLGNVTPLYNLSEPQRQNLKERLIDEQVGLIFSNTIVNIDAQIFLSFLNVPQIVFVHELSYVLSRNYSIKKNIDWLQENVSHFITCAAIVKDTLVQYLEIEPGKASVIHEFIADPDSKSPANYIKNLKKELDIQSNAFVIGFCGMLEWRKSADLLPLIAVSLCQNNEDIHLVWLGAEKDIPLYEAIEFDLEKAGINKRVHLVEKQLNSGYFFELFDITLMVSREDPFPLTNLESGLAGKPIICFKNSGGSEDYASMGGGDIVPYLDIAALKDKVLYYYNNRQLLTDKHEVISRLVKDNFTTDIQGPKVLKVIEQYYDREEVVLIEEPSIAVMTHIFYDDSWEEIKIKLKYFDNGNNYFFFSISEDCLVKESIVKDIKASFRNAYALITSNIGKDIGGKFVLIDFYLTLGIHPEYIIFLHDKKSPQTFVGEAWKNNLYKILDPAYYKLIQKAFQKDSAGIVGAKEHIMNEYSREERRFIRNNEISHRFLKKYEISIDNYDFLSGTMYWIKAAIIEDFFTRFHPISVRKDLEAGNVLDNYNDTIAHTWERMFCWIATNYGYSIKGI